MMSMLKRRGMGILLAAVCIGLTALVAGFNWLERPDLMQYDLHFRLRGPEKVLDPIVIVALDAESKTSLGLNRKISRRTWALALNNLFKAGAKTVGVDVMWTQAANMPGPDYEYSQEEIQDNRDLKNQDKTAEQLLEKDPAWEQLCNDPKSFDANLKILVDTYQLNLFNEDELLECVMNLNPKVILPLITGSDGKSIAPYRAFQARAAGIGAINLERDKDEIVRRLSPVFKLPSGSEFYDYPAFPVAVAAHFLDEDDWEKTLNRIPGRSLLIHYRGYPGSFKTIPLWQVVDPDHPLNPKLEPDVFKDKIVLIGSTDAVDHDMFFTPFSSASGALKSRGVETGGLEVRGGIPTFGIEIHANAVSTILRGDGLRRIDSRIWWLIFILLSLVLAFINVKLKSLFSNLATLGAIILIPVLSHLSFLFLNLWVPIWAFLLVAVLLKAVLGIYKRTEVVHLFGRFVPPAVVRQLVDNPKLAEKAGERKNITILFSDIRGFTSLSEAMSPEEVVAMLNDYLERMTEIVFNTGGTLDKFIGDAVMALWGTPLRQTDHPQRALRAALMMHKELDRLRADWKARGHERDIRIGIGINTADVVVGNIGSRKRVDYTAIGDGVNLASRLEGLCKQYGVGLVISETTFEAVKDMVLARELDLVKVKGKTQALRIYQVFDFKAGVADNL